MQITKILFIITTSTVLLFASALADPGYSAPADGVHWGAVEAGQTEANTANMRNKIESGEWKVNETIGDEARTPLHWAAQHGQTVGLKILLEYGAAVNKQDNDGWTALHYTAANGGHLETIRILLQYGAGINIKTNAGQTPADLLNRTYKETLKLLK